MKRFAMTHRRVSRSLAAALAAVLLLGPGWFGSLGLTQVQAQTQRYWWSVVNERGEVYPQGAVTCSVHPHNIASEGTHVYSTMGSPGSGTTSPLVSNAQGVFEFFWTSASASFDVVCVGRGGMTRQKMTDNTIHLLMMDRSGVRRVSRFAFHNAAGTGNAGQIGTDVVIPQGGVIRDVIVNVTSWGRGISQHLNIGFAGNHAVSTMTALADGLNLSSHGVGWIRPHAIATAGFGNVLAGNHRGGALSRFHQSICFGGVCSGITTAGGISLYLETPYLVHLAGGLQVTYQISLNPDTIAGHAYILWDQLHIGANRWSTVD